MSNTVVDSTRTTVIQTPRLGRRKQNNVIWLLSFPVIGDTLFLIAYSILVLFFYSGNVHIWFLYIYVVIVISKVVIFYNHHRTIKNIRLATPDFVEKAITRSIILIAFRMFICPFEALFVSCPDWFSSDLKAWQIERILVAVFFLHIIVAICLVSMIMFVLDDFFDEQEGQPMELAWM